MGPEFINGRLNEREVGTKVPVVLWCANGEEVHVGEVGCLFIGVGKSQASGGQIVPHKVFEFGLKKMARPPS